VMADTASYSDWVFGLFFLLGYQFSPRLADLGEARFWRIDPRADYGPLSALARHRLDTEVIAANWEDLLRVAGSLATGKVKPSEFLRTLRGASPGPSISGLETNGIRSQSSVAVDNVAFSECRFGSCRTPSASSCQASRPSSTARRWTGSSR
jgi:Tn3 transposase DDE domain